MQTADCTDNAVFSTSGLPAINTFAFADINRPNVIIDTIKGAEDGDGIIVRVYESQGARCNASLTFGFAAKEAAECNLMEVWEQNLDIADNKLSFYIKPYEIKTFRIRKA